MQVHFEVARAPERRPAEPARGRGVVDTDRLVLRLASVLAERGHAVSLRGFGWAGQHGGADFLADDAEPGEVDRLVCVDCRWPGDVSAGGAVAWPTRAGQPRDCTWDAIVARSQYHADLLRERLPAAEIRVIAPAAAEPARASTRPDRFLYDAPPERGLHRLLAAWPAIWSRHRLPLSITHETRSALVRHAHQAGAVAARLGQVAAAVDQPGVVLHGPLDAARLASLRARSLAFLYPLEPIGPDGGLAAPSVLDACAAGLPPVLSPVRCLASDYEGVAKFVGGFEQSRWAEAVADVVSDRETWSVRARAHAERHPWASFEGEWLELLERDPTGRARPAPPPEEPPDAPPARWAPVLRP